jgi:N-methylhydantoinase B
MPGGGGLGPAFDRDADSVVEDVRAEMVSAEAARSLYGVVLSEDGTCDRAATLALRRNDRVPAGEQAQ